MNHGRWIEYEVTLPSVPPARDAAASTVVINHVGQEDRVTGKPARWKIDATVVMPMTFTARVQRWNLGLKVLSVTVKGRMTVRMQSTTLVGLTMDYSEIPPALVLDPRIQKANLKLQSFKVSRVSHIGGEVAQGWGEIMEEVLVERFVEKSSHRLAAKLNKAIDKNRGDLRMSMADWLATW